MAEARNEKQFVSLKDLRGRGPQEDPVESPICVKVITRRYGLKPAGEPQRLYIKAEIKDVSGGERETMRCIYFEPGDNRARFNRGSTVEIKNFEVQRHHYFPDRVEIHLLPETEITEIETALPVRTLGDLSELQIPEMDDDARFHIESECIISIVTQQNPVYNECPRCEKSIGRCTTCTKHPRAITRPHFSVEIDLCAYAQGEPIGQSLTIRAYDEHMQILLPELDVNEYASAKGSAQEKMLEGLGGMVIRGVKLERNDPYKGYRFLEPFELRN